MMKVKVEARRKICFELQLASSKNGEKHDVDAIECSMRYELNSCYSIQYPNAILISPPAVYKSSAKLFIRIERRTGSGYKREKKADENYTQDVHLESLAVSWSIPPVHSPAISQWS